MKLVKLPYKLPRRQAKKVNKGLREISEYNPAPLEGERESWLVFDGDDPQVDEPVGYLSVRKDPEIPGAGEIAVNFWGAVSVPKLLVPRWIEQELGHYDFYTARVFAFNNRVKRFLQRGGFALLGKGPGLRFAIELYGVSRAHFLSLWLGNEPVESAEEEPEDVVAA